MIKQIIEQLSSQEIILSHALVRATLLLSSHNYPKVTEWINNERHGYSGKIDQIPNERRMNVPTVGIVRDQIGREYELQIDLSPLSKYDEGFKYETWVEASSISDLEGALQNIDGDYVYIRIGEEVVRTLRPILTANQPIELLSVYRQIPKSCYRNIIAKVSQRLIDELIKLNAEIDQMEDQVSGDIQNQTSYITNNIYGSIADSNVGGKDYTSIHFKNDKISFDSIASLGVKDEEMTSLKNILILNQQGENVDTDLAGWFNDLFNDSIESKRSIDIGKIMIEVNKFKT